MQQHPPRPTLFPYTTLFRSVSGILETVEAKLVQLARHPRTHRLGVRVRAVGKLDLLPDSVVAAIREAEEATRSEEHTSELQSHSDLVCRLLLEKKKQRRIIR